MTSARKYSKEEMAKLGDAAFNANVLPKLGDDDKGKFVAVDVESGEYAIDANDRVACDKLLKRVPNAQIWMVRAGFRYLTRFGGRGLRAES